MNAVSRETIEAQLGADGWRKETLPPGFPSLIGPIWSRVTEGELRLAFHVDAKHLNSRQSAHGGMLMAFADHALGLYAGHGNPGVARITVQFNMQFVAAAPDGGLVETRARTVRRTRSLLFIEASLVVGDTTVAAIQCIFKLAPQPAA